jgi:hypothetical protein
MRPGLARACVFILAAVAAPRDAPAASPAEPPCTADGDCGYQPDKDRCAADPRANRQPPIADQGIVCYCDDASRRCSMLRVLPVPCESDASCAVSLVPRPHPVAADAAHPHEQGRPCKDHVFATTCEHTNLCTMRRLPCPAAGGGAR